MCSPYWLDEEAYVLTHVAGRSVIFARTCATSGVWQMLESGCCVLTSAAAGVPGNEYEIHLGYIALAELTGRIHRRGLPTVSPPSGANTDSEEAC